MQSKRSSFDLTLFRKNLSRSWPLWGGASLLGSLVPLYVLLNLLNDFRGGGRFEVDPVDFAGVLYRAVTAVGPWIAVIYAILCAMVVWSYLDNPRAVGFLHTLPISREALFLTNTLSGLSMMLIPYAVTGGFLCIIALGFGFFHFYAVMQTVAAVILLSLLFFGMATLCAMLTGNLFAMPALYLLLNVAVPGLSLLVSGFSGAFLMGVDPVVAKWSRPFAPVHQLYLSFRAVDERVGDGVHWSYVYHLEGLWVVALYGLAGLALLGLSLLLYRARHSERAGDVVAFRWLRPVFRFGLAVLAAFTLGWLLYALMWGRLFQEGEYADLLPMIGCTVLCGLVGYFGASMLLEKSLRVFHKKSLLGALALAVLVVGVNVSVRYDLFGVESRVPALDQIQTVTFRSGNADLDLELTAGEDDELIEMTVALHRAILAEADTVRDFERWGYAGNYDFPVARFDYTLKNGERFNRYYVLPVAEDWKGSAPAFDDAFVAFANDARIRREQLENPWDSELDEVMLYGLYALDPDANNDQSLGEHSAAVHEALLRDAEAGRFRGYDPRTANLGFEYRLNLDLRFRVRDEDSVVLGPDGEAVLGYYDWYEHVELTPAMTETLDALLDAGFMTREQVEQWQAYLVEWEAHGGDPEKFPEYATDEPVATELG